LLFGHGDSLAGSRRTQCTRCLSAKYAEEERERIGGWR
jgi:hypothetical protein